METDDSGDARLRLSPDEESAGPVPEELPLAGELVLAVVEDPTGATVLEGEFESRSYGFAGPHDLVYYERIALDPVDDYARRGIARVSRDGDDIQRFESRACGLELGEMYEIRIDGNPAGQVTADSVGHAAIELSTADVDNPLATDVLGPIEDYVLVEWVWLSQSLGDTTALTGSFTGENRTGGDRRREGGGGGCEGEDCGPGDNGNGGGNGDENGGNGHQGDGSGDGDQNNHGGDAGDDDENGHHGDGECDGSGDGECDGGRGSGDDGPNGGNGS
jgi:hypothetical protein